MTVIVGGAPVDGSGSIAVLNVSQQVFAANPGRRYLLIQNQSDTAMFVNFGTAAVTTQPSIRIDAGAALEFGAHTGFVPTGTVNIICSAATKVFVAKQA